MVWFFLDDERGNPGYGEIVIPDYKSMINAIDMCVENDINFGIDFDYDLGDPYYSGERIARYIVSNNILMYGFSIHSSNAEGAEKIRSLLTENGYTEYRSMCEG